MKEVHVVFCTALTCSVEVSCFLSAPLRDDSDSEEKKLDSLNLKLNKCKARLQFQSQNTYVHEQVPGEAPPPRREWVWLVELVNQRFVFVRLGAELRTAAEAGNTRPQVKAARLHAAC